MKIHILCVSDSDKHFAEAIQEYEKRLGKHITITNVRPYRAGTPVQIVHHDTQKVLQYLENNKDRYTVMLSKDGKEMNTLEFYDLACKKEKVLFIIGGAYGLDEMALKPYVNLYLNFGRMTLQHGLAKLVLLEQIYRVAMIQGGREYHY